MQPAMKRSKQRDAIMEYLLNTHDHPTADMIYSSIRKEYPNISLGTVYRNLALLAERGEIMKISYDDGPDRYDGFTEPHYHFVCKECGTVIDINMDHMERINQEAKEHFDGQIDENIIYFKGVCKKCLEKHIDK